MHATIVDGNRTTRARVGEPDGRVVSSPVRAARPAKDRLSPRGSAGAGDVGRFGALGRLFESGGREWAEALQLRQLDRKLGRFTEKLLTSENRLEQVKLYPPYLLNESKRAAAIRQFNGVAAEAALLVGRGGHAVELQALEPDASTSNAERAIDSLVRLRAAVTERRASLREAGSANGPDGGGEYAAARLSDSARRQLVEATRGLSRQASQLLRDLV